jgi:dihydroorotate dehydrogenase
MMLYRLARPLLFAMEPERAHGLTLRWLDRAHAAGIVALAAGRVAPLPCTVMGLLFPNPVGLAAGLDKNAEHIDALAALGFGFLEVGTVTPRPQPGNPPPRLFRIPEARALINRMGFNNLGVDRLVLNVRRSRYRGVLGVNIGKNFDTPLERAADDYLYCLQKVYPVASYVAVNVSSPNTADLRALQHGAELGRLLSLLAAQRERLAREWSRRVPLAVKIAPDLDDADIADIARTLIVHEIDAAIATNTTVSRAGIQDLRHAAEAGGLSGSPLKSRAAAVGRKLAAELRGRVALIGVGGILNGEDARERLDAGASLVQVYTGLVYRGPALIREAAAACARSVTQHQKE